MESLQLHRYRIFAVGALGTFMATFDSSILNVALPSIASDLNASVDVVAWVALSYTLTMVSLLMAFGAWTKSRGYAFAYKFGYVFFIIGSLGCALSSDIYQLISGRVLQAIGTAMFSAVGAGMVTDVFDPADRGKGMGMMMMMVSGGFLVGPPVGGLMLSIWPWQSLFYMNIPIGIIGLFLISKYFRQLEKPKVQQKVPVAGSIAIGLTLVCGMLAIRFVGDNALTDVRVWGTGLVSLLALIAFIRLETNPNSALIGLSILRNRQFRASVISMVAGFVATSGVLILVPFYLERIMHLEPKVVGLFLIILPILMFVMGPLSGRLSDKIGFRFLTSAGILTIAAGLFLLSGLEVDSTKTDMVIALIVVGLGIGIFNTPNASALMGSVDESQRAVTSGIMATTRNIGMTLGIALATSLFAYLESGYLLHMEESEAFVAAYQWVTLTSAGILLLALPFCLTRANKLQPTNK